MRHHAARGLLTLAVVLAVHGATAAPAGALAPGQQFGVADQNAAAAIYQDPRLTRLKPTITRHIADFDVAETPGPARNQLDSWYAAARQNKQRMLIAFGGFLRAAPTAAEYRAGLTAFRARYPAVTEWEPMNEANHTTQPTWDSPALAARYTLIAREVCPGCTIVQLSLVLGFNDPIGYTRRFLAHLPPEERRRLTFGVHTYSDSNRGTSANLTAFLRTFPKGAVWITEAAALALYGPNFPLNVRRQSATTALVFRQALAARRRVKRLYWYEWDGPTDPLATWDSGLLNGSGNTRPAYRVAARERFRRRLTRPQLQEHGLADLVRASRHG